MISNKPATTGLRRIINAGFYSAQGLKAAYRYEAAFRQECLLFILLTPLAFIVTEQRLEQALLIGSLILILIIELLNSAIEAVVDRIGPEQHPLSGRAKDIGSAAVLLTLLNAVILWFLIIIP